MYHERTFVIEKPSGLFDTSSGIEQLLPLIREFNPDAETIVCFHKIDDLLSEVVYVNDDFIEARSRKSFYGVLQ